MSSLLTFSQSLSTCAHVQVHDAEEARHPGQAGELASLSPPVHDIFPVKKQQDYRKSPASSPPGLVM